MPNETLKNEGDLCPHNSQHTEHTAVLWSLWKAWGMNSWKKYFQTENIFWKYSVAKNKDKNLILNVYFI